MKKLIALLVVSLIVVGCSANDGTGAALGPDAGEPNTDAAAAEDAAIDVATDASDAPADVTPDVTPDAEETQDADDEPEADAPVDVTPDVTPDAVDAQADATSDAPQEAQHPEAVPCECSNPGFCQCTGYSHTITQTWQLGPVDGGHVPYFDLFCEGNERVPLPGGSGTCTWTGDGFGAQFWMANGVSCTGYSPSGEGTLTATVECLHCWAWECSQ